MPLGKEASDVRLVEQANPRSETTGSTGTAGFGNAGRLAAQAFGDLNADKAATAQGELVNDFLAQRVEASLETEGFQDLSGEAKDQVIRGVGEFDRHLTQVVKSKGGNAFTKAEILRTRKAMEAISANPANAEAVIKAAGLADKVASPLAQLLKDEEETRIEVRADAAQFRRQQAQDLSLIHI